MALKGSGITEAIKGWVVRINEHLLRYSLCLPLPFYQVPLIAEPKSLKNLLLSISSSSRTGEVQ